jgi:glycosyltransferase involved in cell wall biosynthesis
MLSNLVGMTIHVWVPEYTSAVGGIQTFSRFVVRALRDIFPGAELEVFSKNDTSFPDPTNNSATIFRPLGWWPTRLRTAAFAAELTQRAVRERPNLIITTHANFAPVAHSMKALLGIPYLAIGHGIEVWDLKQGTTRRALRAATMIAAVSAFTRDRMSSVLRLPKDAIAILPNTFDPEEFYPDTRKPHFLLARYRLRPDQPVILTISRLASAERYKGYDQILRSLAKVRERFPDVRYILGGRGPDRGRIESLVRELRLTANVTLAGYVPDHELRSHYNLCDVFAMPSKGEGFGIVFLEAMACGKPVVAGNKDGSVDAVLHGQIGALVDPDSVNDIGLALVQILAREHPQKLLFNPEVLRQKAIAVYGYDQFVGQLERILQPLTTKSEVPSSKLNECAASVE